MKQFEQAMLQVESYSMDVILQIFKWSISPGIPFSESLVKKPLIIIDDLFRWANKYYVLEDDVQRASQQILVINQPTKNDKGMSSKPSNQTRQCSRRQDNQQQTAKKSTLEEKLISAFILKKKNSKEHTLFVQA